MERGKSSHSQRTSLSALGVLDALEKALKWVCDKFMLISAAGGAAMLFLTVADIVGSKLLNKPIQGSIDFTSILLLIIGAFGLAQTEILEKNVRVDFLTIKFSPRGQSILQLYNGLLGISIFVIAVRACFRYTIGLFHSGDSSFTMEIVWWPFVGLLSLNLVLVLLVIASRVFDSWKKLARKGTAKQ